MPSESPTTAASPSSAETGSRSPALDGAYANASNQDMFTAVLDGLAERFGLRGEKLDAVIGGAVLKHSRDFNLMRESVLGSSLSPYTPAYRPAAGLRHRSAGGDRRRRRYRPRPLPGGRRRRRGHHLDAPIAFGDDLRGVLLSLRRSKSNLDRPQAGRQAARRSRCGDPHQRRTPHRAVDGRACRHHRQGDGRQARRPGRAGRGQPPQHGRRLRPRILRRPGHPVPRRLPRQQPARRLVGREAGQAQAGLRCPQR